MTFLTRPTQVWVKHGVLAVGCLLVLSLVNVGSSHAQELAEPEAESITLATFHLSNGNTVEFHGVPAIGSIGYFEKGTIGESMPVFYTNEELTILQKFLILAPEDTPLPRMLVESEAAAYEERILEMVDSLDDLSKAGVPTLDQLIAERGVVDELPEPLEIELDPLALTERFQTFAQSAPFLDESDEPSKGTLTFGGGFWSCSNSGWRFRLTFCTPAGPCWSGRNPADRRAYSSSRKRYAYTVDAYCGPASGYVRARHYWRYNLGRRWHHVGSGPQISSWQWGWTQWAGTVRLRRMVKHDMRRAYLGYYRAFTAFHN